MKNWLYLCTFHRFLPSYKYTYRPQQPTEGNELCGLDIFRMKSLCFYCWVLYNLKSPLESIGVFWHPRPKLTGVYVNDDTSSAPPENNLVNPIGSIGQTFSVLFEVWHNKPSRKTRLT